MTSWQRAMLIALLAAGCDGSEPAEPDATVSPDAGADAGVPDAGAPDAIPPDASPWPARPEPGQFARALIVDGIHDQTSIAVDADGSIFVAGDHQGAVSLGSVVLPAPTGPAVAIVKLTADGAPVWARSLSGGTAASIRTIAATPDGDLIVGGVYRGAGFDPGRGALPNVNEQDAFLARLDGGDGATAWQKAFTASDWYNDRICDVAVEPGGDLYVYGYLGRDAHIDGAPFDRGAFLARLRGDGTLVWSRSYPDADPEWNDTLALDAQHRPVIAGTFTGTLTLDEDTALTVAPGSDFYYSDTFVAAFDGDGNARFAVQLQDEHTSRISALAVGPQGDLYLGGETGGGQIVVGDRTIWGRDHRDQMYVLRLSPEGRYAWATTFDVGVYQSLHDVAVDADGAMYALVPCDGPVQIAPDFACTGRNSSVLASYDRNNRWRWATYVDAQPGWAQELALSDGRLLVVGETQGEATDFGGVRIPETGFFVAEVAP
jgi:hypothetical protein